MSATAELAALRERSRAAVAARPGVLLVAVCLGGMMVGLDGSAITIAAPSIARSVHATLGDLTVIANVYLVMLAVCILPAGRLADRVGRRAGFIAGAAGFAACSVGISLSTTVAEMVVLRAGQGMFAALLQPTALALLSTGVARDRLPTMLAVWGGVNALTIGLGPVFAGFVVQGLGWPVVFLVNVPVAMVAIGLVRVAIGESRASGHADGVGALLGRHALRTAAVLVALSSFAVFALLFALTLFLQNVHGLSPSTAGAWLLAPTLAVVVGAVAGGALTDRVGPRRPVVAGMVMVAVGLGGLSRLSVDSGCWALALLSTGVARERLPTLLAVWGGVNALTIGLGPVFAGFVVQGLGWPVVFLVNVPVAMVAIGLVRVAIGESRARGHADGVGALLGRHALRTAAVLVALSSFAVFALLFALTLYLQNVHGLSPSTAGAWLLAPTLAVVVGALAGGALTDRVGPRRPVVVGMVVVAAGLVGLSRLSVDSGYWALALPALLVGLGIGVWVIPATTTIVSDPEDREQGEAAGTASAIQQAASQVGGVLGVAVTSAALSISVSDRLGSLLRAARVPGHATAVVLHSQGLVEEGRAPALPVTPDHVRALAADAGHLAFAGGMRAAFLVSAALIALCLPLALRWRPGGES